METMGLGFAAGLGFIEREGRLVERRVTAVLFGDAEPSTVVDAVRAFRNPDGGFGHGFEPDKRCPASLPIDVECALDTLLVAGARDERMVLDACDWLATIAPDGAAPLAFPVIEGYPRAEHWAQWAYAPALNPTAGLAGRLHGLGITHPWLDRATEWVWSTVEAGFAEDAHALSEVLVFLTHVPDRERAAATAAKAGDWLTGARWFRADAADPSYGVTPLHLASTPDSPWRALFSDGQISAHLDRLAGDQLPDGGWPITWEPPGQASTLEWRGIETLRALRTLRAYERI